LIAQKHFRIRACALAVASVAPDPITRKKDRRNGEWPVLARDIYRDLYEDSGPTTAEKIMLAGKRMAIVMACGALTVGIFDYAGVHSVPGLSAFVQSARVKIVGGIEPQHHHSAKSSAEAVRVAIPKTVSRPKVTGTSPVDAIAAAGGKDALTTAMTSPTLALPTFAAAPSASVSAKPGSFTGVKTQALPQHPGIELSDLAARSQASVAPARSIQLASLPAPATADDAIATSKLALIPLNQVPLPKAAPPISPAERLELSGKEYARAERCLANAIYFEARSEPIRGQMAVAQVVINRVFSGFYPNDVCGVVYQNASRHLACQFTFACDGKSKAITDRGHWAVANRIARQTLDGQIYVPEVAKSTHYHAAYVRPTWVREMRKLVRYGLHSFYRPYAWGNGNEEPVWGPAETGARVHKTASR
jgi:spore germination cell wall hydrolase CwlJ-like protein